MQLIPILVVEDYRAALDFYTEALQAVSVTSVRNTTQLRVQDQVFAVRAADDTDGAGAPDGVLLLIETAAPDVVLRDAVKHGADIISPVSVRESGVRAGRFRDPFGFQWIVSTRYPR